MSWIRIQSVSPRDSLLLKWQIKITFTVNCSPRKARLKSKHQKDVDLDEADEVVESWVFLMTETWSEWWRCACEKPFWRFCQGAHENPRHSAESLWNGDGPSFLTHQSHITFFPYELSICILLRLIDWVSKPNVSVFGDKCGDLTPLKWVPYPKQKWDCICCFPAIWIHNVELAVYKPGRQPGITLAG